MRNPRRHTAQSLQNIPRCHARERRPLARFTSDRPTATGAYAFAPFDNIWAPIRAGSPTTVVVFPWACEIVGPTQTRLGKGQARRVRRMALNKERPLTHSSVATRARIVCERANDVLWPLCTPPAGRAWRTT